MAGTPQQAGGEDDVTVDVDVDVDVTGSIVAVQHTLEQMEAHLKGIADALPRIAKVVEANAKAVSAAVDQQSNLLSVLAQAVGAAPTTATSSVGLDHLDAALIAAESASTPEEQTRAIRDVTAAARAVRGSRVDRYRIVQLLRRQTELARNGRPPTTRH